MIAPRVRGWMLGCGLIFEAGLIGFSAEPPPWHLDTATTRFELKITRHATHNDCGIFVTLPDGGILPRPNPFPVVTTPDGKTLDAAVLWQGAEHGLSLVFADPGKKVNEVYVYLATSSRSALWTPSHPLKPSALLCTSPGQRTLADAYKLAQMGSVGPSVHVENKAGIGKAPLSVGGDDTGRPQPAVFYQLSHLNVTDPGKIWFAPFTQDGHTEVRVNGTALVLEKRIDKWGGTGAYVDLPAGLARVEVFQTAEGQGPYSNHARNGGLMYLTWRTPKMPMDELGGVRSDQVPMTGTSRMETRIIRDNEIARSGAAQVVRGQSKNGMPLALARVKATHVYWFENEMPVMRYEFEALTDGHPEGTRYAWTFPDQGVVLGDKASWLLPGFRELKVQLTVESKQGRSQSMISFFGFAPVSTSLENAAHRRAYRDTFRSLLEHTPLQPDGAESWPAPYWSNLNRTLEWGQGFEVLALLLGKRSELVKKQLGEAGLIALQDRLLDLAPKEDPAKALAWAANFALTAPAERRVELMVREGEIQLFYQSKVDAAGAYFNRALQAGGEAALRARIRLGDLAFLSGDINRATAAYAGVQNAVRLERNNAAVAKDAWKLNALLEVSASENVSQLIDGGYLDQAKVALAAWERSFPLAKINSDYLIQESRLYQKAGDWVRARVMLEAYCDNVDASSFLPDATLLVLECMKQMKTPDAEVQAFGKKLLERLEFHPVAEKIRKVLER